MPAVLDNDFIYPFFSCIEINCILRIDQDRLMHPVNFKMHINQAHLSWLPDLLCLPCITDLLYFTLNMVGHPFYLDYLNRWHLYCVEFTSGQIPLHMLLSMSSTTVTVRFVLKEMAATSQAQLWSFQGI